MKTHHFLFAKAFKGVQVARGFTTYQNIISVTITSLLNNYVIASKPNIYLEMSQFISVTRALTSLPALFLLVTYPQHTEWSLWEVFSNTELCYGLNKYQYTASASSGMFQHSVDMWLSVRSCARSTVLSPEGLAVMALGEGCIAAVAAWSSSHRETRQSAES